MMLLLYTLNISRAAFHADPDRILTAAEHDAYFTTIRRRLNNEPIQYITGEQEFYGLALHVTPAVLIPRPETEHLVEAVIASLPHAAPLQILDIGTGSGAIAIALAHRLPQANLTAVDISQAALEVAAANAARHRFASRIRFLQSDLLGAFPPHETFDCIVSNPPYVPLADLDSLHPQVRDFEPASALFAGQDGLAIYRRIIPAAESALARNGLLALEIGQGQQDAIAGLLADWRELSFVQDLQGIPRVALARRR